MFQRFRASHRGKQDVHTRLMRRYEDIPNWWFYTLLVVTAAVAMVLCTVFKDEVQLPWWGLLFACAMAFFFTLPISVIAATTNTVHACIYILPRSLAYMIPIRVKNIGLR